MIVNKLKEGNIGQEVKQNLCGSVKWEKVKFVRLYKKIMNEEDNCDHNVEGDAEEGPEGSKSAGGGAGMK